MGKFVLIRTEGGSKVVSLTTFLPRDWKAIDISVIKVENNAVILKFDKVK